MNRDAETGRGRVRRILVFLLVALALAEARAQDAVDDHEADPVPWCADLAEALEWLRLFEENEGS